MLPGVAHTANSALTAFVTGDEEKARRVSAQDGATRCHGFDGYETMLRASEIDAVNIATRNWRHAEFAVPALKAGIHVLLGKPMDVTNGQVQRDPRSQTTSHAKLMVDPRNHCARSGDAAGPVFDMRPYPGKAARRVEDEPVEVVSAAGTRHPDSGLADSDHSVAVTLRFPRNRLAQFVVSCYANTIDTYFTVWTKGSIQMSPGYMYGKPLEQFSIIEQKQSHESFKTAGHFGHEMKYFLDCILQDLDPEPDREEGWPTCRFSKA